MHNLAVLPDFDEGDRTLLLWIELGDVEVKVLGLRISWNDERVRASACDVLPQSAQDVLLGGQIPGPIPSNIHHLDDNPIHRG